MFLLPVGAFILICIINVVRKKSPVESVANAWITISLYAWGVMELLSTFECWNKLSTLVAWSGMLVALLIYSTKIGLWYKVVHYMQSDSNLLKQYFKSHKYIIFQTMFLLIVLLTALTRSQNLADNLTHRLPKIMHWIQNSSVKHFATSSLAQIQYTNFSEYLNAQIYILGGNDRIINIVQFGAYVCTAIFIFGIGKKIGLSNRFSLISSWIYLLIPAVIIETCTTQTDGVAASYLLIFIYFLLDFIHKDKLVFDKNGCISAIKLASSVMLGFLVKPTVCFVMLIFFIWMCIVRIYKQDKIAVLCKYILAGGIVAVILYSPSCIRNYQLYKTNVNSENNFVSANEESIQVVEVIPTSEVPNRSVATNVVVNMISSPVNFLMSCIQNIGTNASSRCFPKLNEFIIRAVNKCGSMIGYSFPYGEFLLLVDSGAIGETSEPSPCIMWLCLASWVLVIFRVSRINKEQFIYLLSATIGLIVQSGMMGYTYFRVRYLIGAMGVLCPAFMVILQNVKANYTTKRDIAVAILAISGLGTVNALSHEIACSIEGFKGEKIHQYFLYYDNEAEYYYNQMAEFADSNGYTHVGIAGTIQYEYVLWQSIDNLERLEMVNVEDAILNKYEDRTYIPECIFMETKTEVIVGDTLVCHDVEYECIWSESNNRRCYTAYVPKNNKIKSLANAPS